MAVMTVLFAFRVDATPRLAAALDRDRHKHALVLAIPRGAVEMGRILACRDFAQVEKEAFALLARAPAPRKGKTP
jgi:hypothetical protein